MALRLHSEGDDHVLATYRNIVIMVWRTADTFAPLRLGGPAVDELRQQHGNGKNLASVTWVADSAGLPNEQLRKEIARFWREREDFFAGGAVVVSSRGFKGAASRGAVATILTLMGLKTPVKVFGELDDAGAWLQSRLEGVAKYEPGEIAAALRSIPTT